jgi:hypothetical protein
MTIVYTANNYPERLNCTNNEPTVEVEICLKKAGVPC